MTEITTKLLHKPTAQLYYCTVPPPFTIDNLISNVFSSPSHVCLKHSIAPPLHDTNSMSRYIYLLILTTSRSNMSNFGRSCNWPLPIMTNNYLMTSLQTCGHK